MLATFLTSTLLVALAELGDKTQMLSLVLAARYSARRVLLGVTLAVLALQALAVFVGGALGNLLPTEVTGLVAGGLFIGFGVWTLWRSRSGGEQIDDETEPEPTSRFGPVLGVAAVFFVAELGDKTQLMTVSLAADPGAAARSLSFLGLSVTSGEATAATYVAVWLGTTAGMLLVNGLAIAVGAALGRRLSERTIARISGAVFLLFGVLVLASALTNA